MNLLKFLWMLIVSFFTRKALPTGAPVHNPSPVETIVAPSVIEHPVATPKILEVAAIARVEATITQSCPSHDRHLENSVPLQSLDANFVECTRNPGIHRCHKSTDPLINHGLHFKCPTCHGSYEHYILCLFNHPSVPAQALPTERWTRENAVYGLSKLTLVEPVHASCGWLGHIKDGQVQW